MLQFINFVKKLMLIIKKLYENGYLDINLIIIGIINIKYLYK